MLSSSRLICGLLVLFIWVSGAQALQSADDNETSSVAPSVSEAKPSISVAESVYDFGEADEGGEIVHDFVVRNAGQAPLEINQVRPG